MEKRGQGTFEYVLLLGGVLLTVVIATVVLTSSAPSIPESQQCLAVAKQSETCFGPNLVFVETNTFTFKNKTVSCSCKDSASAAKAPAQSLTPSPTPTPTLSPTLTPSPTPTPSPSPTTTSTAIPSPTPTLVPCAGTPTSCGQPGNCQVCPEQAATYGTPACDGNRLVRTKTTYVPACSANACTTSTVQEQETLQTCEYQCQNGGCVTPPNSLTACRTINSPGYYLLNKDVTSTDSCFTVTSSNVRIDCGGRTLTGGKTKLSSGVFINGVDNVTVINCVIRDFMMGINAYSSSKVNLSSNALYPAVTSPNLWQNYYAQGILLNKVSASHLELNSITGNPGSSLQAGIQLIGSTSNQITKNTIGGSFIFGVYLLSGSNSNTISRNRAETDSIQDVRIDDSSDNVVEYNSIRARKGGTWGISVSWSGAKNNILRGNQIAGSGSTTGSQFVGISLQGPVGTVVEGNYVLNNAGSSKGIKLYASSGTVLKNNAFCGQQTNVDCTRATGTTDQGGNVCDPTGSVCGISCGSGCSSVSLPPIPS